MKIFSLLILCGCSLTAVAKDRNWQEAMIVAIKTSDGPVISAPLAGTIVTGRIVLVRYIVETADVHYELAAPSKALNITVRKPTRIAVDGKNMYLVDDGGKERKLAIVYKEMK